MDRKKTRMLVLGGYLGAGKTTLAVNLARELHQKHGKTVAIITNDQGASSSTQSTPKGPDWTPERSPEGASAPTSIIWSPTQGILSLPASPMS